MLPNDIQAFSDRLKNGDDPIEVFTEIELFYLIREAMKKYNIGNCNYTPDQYDPEAAHLLRYFLSAHEEGRSLSSPEFSAFCKDYFLTMFSSDAKVERLRDFSVFLFQELHTMQSQYRHVRGKTLHYNLMLKIDYQK